MTCDQYTGLNGVVVPGTLRDSLVPLSVVLDAGSFQRRQLRNQVMLGIHT